MLRRRPRHVFLLKKQKNVMVSGWRSLNTAICHGIVAYRKGYDFHDSNREPNTSGRISIWRRYPFN